MNFKLKVSLLGMFIAVGVVPYLVYADVPPMNSYYIERCTRITNIEEFPEIAVFNYTNLYFQKLSLIQNNDCLWGFKGSTDIYWNSRNLPRISNSLEQLILINRDEDGDYEEQQAKIRELVELVIDDNKLLLSEKRIDGYWEKKSLFRKKKMNEVVEYKLIQS